MHVLTCLGYFLVGFHVFQQGVSGFFLLDTFVCAQLEI